MNRSKHCRRAGYATLETALVVCLSLAAGIGLLSFARSGEQVISGKARSVATTSVQEPRPVLVSRSQAAVGIVRLLADDIAEVARSARAAANATNVDPAALREVITLLDGAERSARRPRVAKYGLYGSTLDLYLGQNVPTRMSFSGTPEPIRNFSRQTFLELLPELFSSERRYQRDLVPAYARTNSEDAYAFLVDLQLLDVLDPIAQKFEYRSVNALPDGLNLIGTALIDIRNSVGPQAYAEAAARLNRAGVVPAADKGTADYLLRALAYLGEGNTRAARYNLTRAPSIVDPSADASDVLVIERMRRLVDIFDSRQQTLRVADFVPEHYEHFRVGTHRAQVPELSTLNRRLFALKASDSAWEPLYNQVLALFGTARKQGLAYPSNLAPNRVPN